MKPDADVVIAGRYKIISEIGHGGMQRVWRAVDVSLEREVALKTPLNPGAKKRFASTAQLSARVRHPNVAAALDYLVVDGTEFYIEELVDGLNLDESVSENFSGLDADTAARIMHHLTKGIAASHAVRVVHRDLKPSNVIVSKDLSFTTIKITDFGIAKLAEEQIDTEAEVIAKTSNTTGASSTLLGALPYLPPEVLRKGRPGAPKIGTAADIWGVGAIGYWLLAGQLPFGEGYDAVANILTQRREPWPAAVTANSMTRDLARKLQGIIEECLSSDPSLRPAASLLSQQLSGLGYLQGSRKTGTVASQGKYGGVWFTEGDDGVIVMTHQDEVLGGGRLKIGARVSYVPYPGTPRPRAVAILCMK